MLMERRFGPMVCRLEVEHDLLDGAGERVRGELISDCYGL
jgi:hypothetical protein